MLFGSASPSWHWDAVRATRLRVAAVPFRAMTEGAVQAGSCNCGHAESDHYVRDICEKVIHYPSEDYPCSCEKLQEGDVCGGCGHERRLHKTIRRCRPAAGGFCSCKLTLASYE